MTTTNGESGGLSARARSLAWKVIISLIGTLVFVTAVELCSVVILRRSEGRWISLADIRAEQASSGEIEKEPLDDRVLEGGRHRFIQEKQVIHPYIGYVREPDPEVFPYAHPDGLQFGFAINNFPIFHEPSPRRVVIAVFGGSVAWQAVLEARALQGALSSIPRFAGRDVFVVGLAAGAHKQPQQLMTLNFFLSIGAHFDVVINLDGFNEVTLPQLHNLPQGVYAHYPTNWRFRVGHLDLETRRLIGELTYLRQRRRRTAEAFSASPWRYSRAAAIVWKRADAGWTRQIVDTELELAASRGGDERRDYQATGPQIDYENPGEMLADLVAVWSRSSLQMAALCRELGIEYHHFLQPNQYVRGSKPMSRIEQDIALGNERFIESVAVGYPALQKAGEEIRSRGVAFHDLTTIFADRTEVLYRDNVCHVNREGNFLLAGAIARVIEGARPADG